MRSDPDARGPRNHIFSLEITHTNRRQRPAMLPLIVCVDHKPQQGAVRARTRNGARSARKEARVHGQVDLPAHHASRQPLRACGARAAPWLTVALRRLKSPSPHHPHPRRREWDGEGFRIARWIQAACGRLRRGSSLAAAAARGGPILRCSGFRVSGFRFRGG
jgi:hypothetical protein